MKKTLLPLILALAISATAGAAQYTQTDKGDRYELKYPVFTQESSIATARMNRDISKIIETARKDLQRPELQILNSDYKISYEDDKYISLQFSTYTYYQSAAHGMSYTYGLVYDKTTGRQVPYTEFTAELNAKKLKKDILHADKAVFASDLKTPSQAPFIQHDKNFKVSSNYLISPTGEIYLMYQPYELDSYAAGVTYVHIGNLPASLK